MVIIDTNIIIDHVRLGNPADSIFARINERKDENLAISMITVQELYAGQSTLESKVDQAIFNIISRLEILLYTYQVARLAGEIARDLKRPISLADAAIAATAIINNAKLATLNKKDFQGIPDLKLV